MQAFVRAGFGKMQVHDAGFNAGDTVFNVEFQYAVHARHFDDDHAAQRDRSAAKPRARAARDKRPARCRAGLDHRRDFYGRMNVHHRARRGLVERQAVAFVNEKFLGRRGNVGCAHGGAQGFQ